jgi:hypothetical protein
LINGNRFIAAFTLSNLGNGKSYNSVAIFQTLILVVDPILETIRVIKKT